MKEIKFASIPRCASRSLKGIGLLGETYFHSTILEYPDWYLYDWHRVEVDPQEWLESWWQECRSHVEHLANVLGKTVGEIRPIGMQFISMEDDLKNITTEVLKSMPAPIQVNAWLNAKVISKWDKYRSQGKPLYALCVDSITAGVACKVIKIANLNKFIVTQGLTPVHLNSKEHHAKC
jgi:hypothetical protein